MLWSDLAIAEYLRVVIWLGSQFVRKPSVFNSTRPSVIRVSGLVTLIAGCFAGMHGRERLVRTGETEVRHGRP